MLAEPSEDTIVREYLDQARRECKAMTEHAMDLTRRLAIEKEHCAANWKIAEFVTAMWALTLVIALWGWMR